MPVSEKKKEYGAKLGKYIEKYKAAFIVGCDNVGSKQMQSIRISLRAFDTVVLMGKNTTIRKVIKDYLKKNDKHPIACILEHLVGNVGLVFTNADLPAVRETILKATKPAPAESSAAAPTTTISSTLGPSTSAISSGSSRRRLYKVTTIRIFRRL
jgi:large subunit ribosomal protein LP0